MPCVCFFLQIGAFFKINCILRIVADYNHLTSADMEWTIGKVS